MRPAIAHFHPPDRLGKMRAARILLDMEIDGSVVRLAPVISPASGFIECAIDDSQAMNPKAGNPNGESDENQRGKEVNRLPSATHYWVARHPGLSRLRPGLGVDEFRRCATNDTRGGCRHRHVNHFFMGQGRRNLVFFNIDRWDRLLLDDLGRRLWRPRRRGRFDRFGLGRRLRGFRFFGDGWF